MGCFSDFVTGTRDLDGFGANAINEIGGKSIDACARVCLALGFSYSGNEG